ncbi:MAG: hypothetical protein V1703_02980, partial [Candidatus Altiarchaeota archaeon]
MKNNRKILALILTLVGVLLILQWLYGHNTLAGISGAFILLIITGVSIALSTISWLVVVSSLTYHFVISLPFISVI